MGPSVRNVLESSAGLKPYTTYGSDLWLDHRSAISAFSNCEVAILSCYFSESVSEPPVVHELSGLSMELVSNAESIFLTVERELVTGLVTKLMGGAPVSHPKKFQVLKRHFTQV